MLVLGMKFQLECVQDLYTQQAKRCSVVYDDVGFLVDHAVVNK
jgi:hypothetical protein